MKSYLKLFIAVFFILAAVKTVNSQYFSISGTVRYSDNLEIVTSGQVKLYDANTFELLGACEIHPAGDWIIIPMRVGQLDVIGLPNMEPEADYVATGYPDKTNPEQYTRINFEGNMTGIDIYVQRTQPNPGGSAFMTSLSGKVLDMNKKPVADAMIYAMIGDKYYGFGLSDSKGNYNIKNLPVTDYILVAHKLGNQSVNSHVVLNDIGNSFNIVMNKKNSENIITTPVQFKLSQNYPNPFNPSTTISYNIPVNGNVSIKVYNSLGQLAATLVNEVKDAGSYEVSFDASSLSSGVYFYRLDAGNYSDTKKMTLIK